jgi:hypothetical protein
LDVGPDETLKKVECDALLQARSITDFVNLAATQAQSQ